MSSFLCFVCHSTVNADTNEDTRDKYREVIGMHLCPDSHLCFICCHFLNKMCLFKSICLKRSLEYPVLFSEKGTINLQRSDTQVGILCPEDICLQHLNTQYHFYNHNENSPCAFEENHYVQLHEEMNFGLLPNNVEVQTDDIFDHFNDNLLRLDNVYNNDEFIFKENEVTRKIDEFRKVDEFIFGNDSIESPLDNINKIEMANLEEMSQNITLTDLNVRNFEKLNRNDYFEKHEMVKNDLVPHLDVKNDIQTEIVRNNEFERTHEFVDSIIVEQTYKIDEKKNEFVEKQEILNFQNKLVDNIEFVENHVQINDNFNEDLFDNRINEITNVTQDNNDTLSSNNESGSESDTNTSENDTNTSEFEAKQLEMDANKSEKDRNIFTKLVLTLEEQKTELEVSRKGKKYTEAVYKCYSCALGFLFKDTYQAHMMRHEESNGEHRCTICTLRFAQPAVIRSHIAANHAVRYQCSICAQVVKARQRRTHAAICQGVSGTTVNCHLCDKVFPGSSHLKQHLKRMHHKKRNRTYLCNVCGKSYSNQAAVRTHMITHVNQKFPCDKCPKIFSSPYTLSQHEKKHYSTTELHHCQTCRVGYTTKKGLLAHFRNALPHKERVYKCPVCDKTCPTLRSLQNHTKTVHLRTRDMACESCPAKYSTRKALVRHMASHNSSTPKLLPLCHACGETFKSTSILKRHLKNVCEKDKFEELPNYYEH